MKKATIITCLALSFIACNNEEKKPAAENKKEEKPLVAGVSTTTEATAIPDSATIQKNWMAYMTVGKEHQMLKEACGTWAGEITIWSAPGSSPLKSNGMEESKMIMGGRYQEAHFKGSFQGQPFEGMSIMGFDNHKKTYFSSWVDNMGTGIMNMEGSWDESTKSLTTMGTCIDPGTGKNCEVRQIFRIIDKDHHFMEMFTKGTDGKEFKSMEISYSRKK